MALFGKKLRAHALEQGLWNKRKKKRHKARRFMEDFMKGTTKKIEKNSSSKNSSAKIHLQTGGW